MKKLVLLSVAALTLGGMTAQAMDRVYVGARSGYYHRGYNGCRWHRCGGGTSVGVACAPEVVEGNIAATDRTLKTVIAEPAFANATEFKTEVNRIAAIPNTNDKLGEYFGMIGIDSNNKDAVAEFVGARDVNGRWTDALQHNVGLNADQASTVAAQLQTALRGGLQ